MRRLAKLSPVLFVLLATKSSVALPGDLATRFRVNDEDPMSSIPSIADRNADPLEFGYFLQDVIVRAEGALSKQDFGASAKYYETLAKAVPDRAISFSRLCFVYTELRKLQAAEQNCAKAVSLSGAKVIDHFRWVNLLIAKPNFTPADLEAADASLAQVRAHIKKEAEAQASAAEKLEKPKTPREQIFQDFVVGRGKSTSALADPGTPVNLPLETEALACKVGVRVKSAERLDQCIEALGALGADPKFLLPFEWGRALVRRDVKQADALIEAAREAGFSEPALKTMVEEQNKAFYGVGFMGFARRWGVIALVSVALLVFAFVLLRRTRKLAAPGDAPAS